MRLTKQKEGLPIMFRRAFFSNVAAIAAGFLTWLFGIPSDRESDRSKEYSDIGTAITVEVLRDGRWQIAKFVVVQNNQSEVDAFNAWFHIVTCWQDGAENFPGNGCLPMRFVKAESVCFQPKVVP